MKTLLPIIGFLLFIQLNIYSQEIKGEILVNDQAKIDFTNQFEKEGYHNPVFLFRDYVIEKHQINFSFRYIGETEKNLELKQLPKKELEIKTNTSTRKTDEMLLIRGSQQFTYFQFKTIVHHNGEKIGELKRKPFPYFPGDMFVGIEAFDVIPILSHYANQNVLKEKPEGKVGILPPLLPKGQYKIQLQALPMQAEFSTDGYKEMKEQPIQEAIVLFSVK